MNFQVYIDSLKSHVKPNAYDILRSWDMKRFKKSTAQLREDTWIEVSFFDLYKILINIE